MTHVCMRMCVALFLLIKVFFFYYCVCAIVCVCMRVGLYVCVRLCLGLYTRVPVCVCMSASEFCACVSLCKRVSVRTREYVCARMCACARVCAFNCGWVDSTTMTQPTRCSGEPLFSIIGSIIRPPYISFTHPLETADFALFRACQFANEKSRKA